MRIRLISVCVATLLLVGMIYAQPTRPNLTTMRRAGVFPLRTKPTREQKRQLEPLPSDIEAFAAFLEQPKTGIIRLLPDLGCYENVNILKADEVCRNSIPESSFYSFREREHTLEILSDIRLKSGYLISDGILTQGILAELGDIRIEDLNLESEGFEFLRTFEPEVAALNAKEQYIGFVRGVRAGRYEYRKLLKANVNSTYAMRVVAYRGNIFRSFRGWKYDLLEGDKRIDMILAFRIVRKSDDGAVTIVWKELERRDSPRMKFPKRRDDSKLVAERYDRDKRQ